MSRILFAEECRTSVAVVIPYKRILYGILSCDQVPILVRLVTHGRWFQWEQNSGANDKVLFEGRERVRRRARLSGQAGSQQGQLQPVLLGP